MALPFDSTSMREMPRTIEAWVWPMISAIVVSGVLVLACVAGLFWLAAHPVQQSTVIWMPAAAQYSTSSASTANPSEVSNVAAD
jgi:hypothetical protein